MNRSLILIIADFLLLSMLAMARFDQEPPSAPEQSALQENAGIGEGGQEELIQVLQMSLEAERESRLEMSQTLENSRTELDDTRSELERKQAQAKLLAQEKADLEARKQELETVAQEHETLKEHFTQTRQKLDETMEARAELAEELSDAKAMSATSSERLRMIQQKLKERETQLANINDALKNAESATRIAELEKQKIQTDLKIASTEKSLLAENLRQTQNEKKQAQVQAQTLAENVGTLAQTQSTMQRELKEMQPLSLNRIFDIYQANRVRVTFKARRRALLGVVDNTDQVESIPVMLAGKPYLIIHREYTPLEHSSVLGLEVDIRRQDGQHFKPDRLLILENDPRVLAIPLPQAALNPSVLDAFPVSADPLRFPEAVAIGEDGVFGEILMKQHPEYRRYFIRDTKFLSSMPGEVSAERGFQVFDKTGRYLGLMVNGRYAILTDSDKAQATVGLGASFSPEQWSVTSDALDVRESRLPLELR